MIWSLASEQNSVILQSVKILESNEINRLSAELRRGQNLGSVLQFCRKPCFLIQLSGRAELKKPASPYGRGRLEGRPLPRARDLSRSRHADGLEGSLA